MFSPMHVRREEITVATLLRRSGYATCHVGKWHLAETRDQPVPVELRGGLVNDGIKMMMNVPPSFQRKLESIRVPWQIANK